MLSVFIAVALEGVGWSAGSTGGTNVPLQWQGQKHLWHWLFLALQHWNTGRILLPRHFSYISHSLEYILTYASVFLIYWRMQASSYLGPPYQYGSMLLDLLVFSCPQIRTLRVWIRQLTWKLKFELSFTWFGSVNYLFCYGMSYKRTRKSGKGCYLKFHKDLNGIDYTLNFVLR